MFKLFLCFCLFCIASAAPKHKQKLARFLPGGRIIGGVDAKIEDFPFIVSLVRAGGHFCAASLISDTWAVTAAHCLDGLYPSQIVVQGNSSLLDDGLSIAAKTLVVHPDFDFYTTDFDIGLIELSKPFNATNAKPVALSRAAPVAGKNATLLGWGIWDPDYYENYDYSQSPILQTAQVPVVDKVECFTNYQLVNLSISDNMFCAGFLDRGGVDSCSGDSGGPVTIDGKLVGAVSWGHGCAQPGFPGVYTLITNFLDWIEQNSGVSAQT